MAVASKFLAAGAVVPFARAGARAVATQSYANPAYGTQGLEKMGTGEAAAAVVTSLVQADPQREQRQVGVVDARGGVGAFTGEECFPWAGSCVGDGYCCLGNILAGPQMGERMAEESETKPGRLADRWLPWPPARRPAGTDEGSSRPPYW